MDVETTHKFGTQEAGPNFDYVPNGGRVPSLTGDIRHLIPKLGLREYWYPLCGAGRVVCLIAVERLNSSMVSIEIGLPSVGRPLSLRPNGSPALTESTVMEL